MADRAKVTSIDAIKSFKSNLIVYLTKARPSLEEISAEILRLRLWLQEDAQKHWQNEIRRRSRKLEDAQQALFSARIANLREPTSAEVIAVTRAKRDLDEADAKLRLVRRWTRDFDSRVEPMAKQLEKLQTHLSEEMPRAVAFLSQAITSLDAYANIAPPSEAGGAAPPAAPAEGAESTEADKTALARGDSQ